MEQQNWDVDKQIQQVIDNYLKADEWKYHYHQDVGIYEMAARVHGVVSQVAIYICINQNNYSVYTESGLMVKPEEKAQMAKWIVKTNYNLLLGNFDFDWEQGRVRYKYTVDCEGQMPSYDMVQNSLYSGIAMFSEFGEQLSTMME